MKSYLEIQVPLRYDAHWLEGLRTALHQINVRWQMGYYHITMAFLDETGYKLMSDIGETPQ